ncbi:MAG: hypothetical protein KH140_07365 [Actinomyces sp.]|nr:hypothetical protein [Actinomyces sp.]
MGAGHSSFSLRRATNRRRYFYALVAADPHQTLMHAVNYWVSKGAWGETNGMGEQLAQHGWVGTEVIIGSDLRSLALSPIIDAILGIDLLPSTAPTSVKRTRQERTEILVAARSCSVGGRPASELWVCEARVVHDSRWATDAFMDMSLGELAGSLERQGLLLEAPRFFHGGDLPKDHLFTMDGILTMRRAARKEHGRRPIRFSGI